MHRVEQQKATMELSIQNLQLLSQLRYPTDIRQLTSPQGEADGVSEGGMTSQGRRGEGDFLAVGTASQGSPPPLEVEITHTHIHTWCPEGQEYSSKLLPGKQLPP